MLLAIKSIEMISFYDGDAGHRVLKFLPNISRFIKADIELVVEDFMMSEMQLAMQ